MKQYEGKRGLYKNKPRGAKNYIQNRFFIYKAKYKLLTIKEYDQY